MFGSRGRSLLFSFLIATVLPPSSSSAQGIAVATPDMVNLASSASLGIPNVQGNDAAYDSVNDRYLVLSGFFNLHGFFVDPSGALVSGPFTIKTGAITSHPRAAFSTTASAGGAGFLVAWAEEVGKSTALKGMIVSASGVVGSEFTISDSSSAPWTQFGVAVAYSATSQKFLTAWQTSSHQVKARLVSNSGGAEGSVITLFSGTGKSPGVVWNSVTDRFGVSFSVELGSASAIGFREVSPNGPVVTAGETFHSVGGGLSMVTDIDHNPDLDSYVATWLQLPPGPPAPQTWAAEIKVSGSSLSILEGLVSNRAGSADSLSVAFSRISGTFLIVGGDNTNDNVLARELTGRGLPLSVDQLIGANANSHYVRVAGSSGRSQWLTSFSGLAFSRISTRLVTTSTLAGGGNAALGSGASGSGSSESDPTPTPTPSNSCSGSAPVSSWVCVGTGWLPADHPLAAGQSSGSGSGGSTPAPTPTPTPTPTAANCTGNPPVSNWVCVGTGWLPPDHPLAVNAPASTPTPTPTPTPGSLATCSDTPSWFVGGGWSKLANGDWVPGNHPLASQAVCRGQ